MRKYLLPKYRSSGKSAIPKYSAHLARRQWQTRKFSSFFFQPLRMAEWRLSRRIRDVLNQLSFRYQPQASNPLSGPGPIRRNPLPGVSSTPVPRLCFSPSLFYLLYLFLFFLFFFYTTARNRATYPIRQFSGELLLLLPFISSERTCNYVNFRRRRVVFTSVIY